jgi:hypothetical protein
VASTSTTAAPSISSDISSSARAVLTRSLAGPAPLGADALRISVLGDKSGAQMRLRLCATNDPDDDVHAYWMSSVVILDYRGWKTHVLPLSAFTYHSEENPETDAALSTPGGALAALPGFGFVQIAVTAAPACKVFVDDLAWTRSDAAVTDPPLAMIDDFEEEIGAVGSTIPVGWALGGGDYDQARTATASVNHTRGYVLDGHGSLQLIVQSPCYAEKQLYGTTLATRLRQTLEHPYAVYVRSPFEPILPDSTPSTQELAVAPQLNVTACAGESEPVSFSVYAGARLRNVTVKVVGPFLSESKQSQLPAEAIDVRVVRLGDGQPQNGDAPLPALLVKDDRESLDGPLPTVRLTGDPSTDIRAGASKQFWVTVRVPRNQFDADYMGKLVISAAGVQPTQIPLRVNVLPMTLKTAFLQYGIDLRSRLSADSLDADDRVVNPATYAAELADVRDHGFHIVTIDEPLATLPQAMQLYKDAGLSVDGPVVIRTPLHTKDEVKQVEALRDSLHFGPDFEIYYEIPQDVMTAAMAGSGAATSTSPLMAYQKEIRAASQHALIVAPCCSRAVYASLSPALDSSTLAPVFSSTSDYTSALLTTGKREIANRDYWSWNIALQSPERNRLLAGLLICRTGTNSSPLYGAFPEPYQCAPSTGAGATRVAYLVNGGVIDTIQWEAVREGVDDVRYYGALKHYIRDLKDAHLGKDATDEAERYLAGVMKRPLGSLSPADYEGVRRGVVTESLKLLTILRSKLGDYPG